MISTNLISGVLSSVQNFSQGILYFCASATPTYIGNKFASCWDGIIFTPLNPSPTPTNPPVPTQTPTPSITPTPTIPASPTPTPTITPTITLLPSSNCLSPHISVYNTNLDYLVGTYSLSVVYEENVNETYLVYTKDSDPYIHIIPNQYLLDTTNVVMYSSIYITTFPTADEAIFLYTAVNTVSATDCLPYSGWGIDPVYVPFTDFDYTIVPVGTLPAPKIIKI